MRPPGKTWHSVADPRAAALLLTRQARPAIAPFLEGECSASSAALGTSLSSAGRLIRQLLQLGLIREVRQ
ncbi:hypothetical protein D3875_13710 [Deinococcus cavernae]|uniref:Uncharacterized protein n=1 Tax=Deinococcus cavernae TaxID=2320857 RepID=A0A418V8N1_9DEIO|nr:hypothetical protein [Deinococcus cavernae]RJF72448.1 hypothetical protein D3875_13710 [Deinococcus cavernae]